MRRNHLRGQGARIETDDIETWLRSACSRRGKLPYRAFEADLRDGRWMWMSETMSANGWMLCQASEITELRADRRALRQERDVALRAAQTDPMTGISNRTHLMQLLELLLQRQRGQHAPACLAIPPPLQAHQRSGRPPGRRSGHPQLRPHRARPAASA